MAGAAEISMPPTGAGKRQHAAPGSLPAAADIPLSGTAGFCRSCCQSKPKPWVTAAAQRAHSAHRTRPDSRHRQGCSPP